VLENANFAADGWKYYVPTEERNWDDKVLKQKKFRGQSPIKINCIIVENVMRKYLVFQLFVLFSSLSYGQKNLIDTKGFDKISDQAQSVNYCSALLVDDKLILENSRISRTFLWNNGNLITVSLNDKQSSKTWSCSTLKPDMSFPGQNAEASNASFSSEIVLETAIKPAHLEATVQLRIDKLEIKRVFRIYPECPAIACDIYLRGRVEKSWIPLSTNPADLQNIENPDQNISADTFPILEKLELPGKHWQLKTVEFFDVTDRFNTLVSEKNSLSYKENTFCGNLLFATDLVSKLGVFILKESPTSQAQLAYPGADFLTSFGTVRLTGAGMLNTDLDSLEWKKAYGFVTGVYTSNESYQLLALRNYQQHLRIHKPERDEQIMMNTWGDKAQDTKVNEAFCMAELDAGASLGITHFQLDDGWQTGRSANSALGGGTFENIWRNENYWNPNPQKFPNGLTSLVEKSKKSGIQICLWFNPSSDNSYINWSKDADALISLYKQYDIRTFKIDGVKLIDKQSEINFRRFLDKVVAESNGEVVFNLDVTAGRRGGYHSFNEYGNIFLENRYTDWQNYYPYATLRNLWMLSKYVPAQNLQIEFLNKWRNTAKYSDDPFAPANYSFNYLFAITMMAQPLAWFEASSLPEQAFSTSKTIADYKKVMTKIHAGIILPLGDEPSGRSWTGFQSIVNKNKGYFLIFREANESPTKEIKIYLQSGTIIKCTALIGKGKSFSSKVEKDGILTFDLATENSFALYSYFVDNMLIIEN
jgi:hypothetical protein